MTSISDGIPQSRYFARFKANGWSSCPGAITNFAHLLSPGSQCVPADEAFHDHVGIKFGQLWANPIIRAEAFIRMLCLPSSSPSSACQVPARAYIQYNFTRFYRTSVYQESTNKMWHTGVFNCGRRPLISCKWPEPGFKKATMAHFRTIRWPPFLFRRLVSQMSHLGRTDGESR
jgi:hypothetical protein